MPDEVIPPATAAPVTPAPAVVVTPPPALATPAAPVPPAAQPTPPAATPPAAGRPAKSLAELLNEPGPDEAQKRIARGVRKALREYGIDVPKDANITAHAEEYKADRAAKKSERRTLREQAAERDSYKTTLDGYAKNELASLSEEQRAFVLGVAPSDARAQLAHITALRASGAIKAAPVTAPIITPPAGIPPVAAPAAAAPAAPAAPAPLPAPANSAPAQPGPVQTTPPVVDHFVEWSRLRASKDQYENARASLYYLTHAYEIASSMARQSA